MVLISVASPAMTRDEVKAAKKATPKFNSADYDE